MCVIGGLFGTIMAMGFLAWGGLAIGAEGVTIAFRPSPSLVLSGALTSLFVGVLAGIIPAIQAARTSIVWALRQA
jgi:putative ABC transport system permease protein